MKFTLEIEDTPRGVRATAYMESNEVTDNLYDSLSGKLIANWTEQLKMLGNMGVLVVEESSD